MPGGSLPLEKQHNQRQLQLTYSVGDFVWARTRSGTVKRRRLLARVESASPIVTAFGDAWCVRCYYSPDKRAARPGWSATVEHRQIDGALSAGELAELRKRGIIPPAGSTVLP